MAQSLRNARRGSMYVMVVGCASLAAVIGISALMALRIERRAAENANDVAEARVYAQSAVELAMHKLAGDANWRTNRTNGAWETNRPIGNGSYSTTLVDPVDGNLADDAGDPVDVTGIGMKGQARYLLRVTLKPKVLPLEVLNTCLHADLDVTVQASSTITVSGAPLSTNATVYNNGAIVGDVHALLVAGLGTISGTVTLLSAPKALPDAGAFDLYRSKATTIPSSSTLENQVLGPGYNPWGAPNAEGVYYMDTGSSDLTIRGFRLSGTLVIKCGSGRRVRLDQAVFMQPYRSDYPVLIVSGDLELRLDSGGSSLSESVSNTNFNPAGAPYQGSSDSDMLDTYPNEVRGLVHAKRVVSLAQSARITGVVLGESTASCEPNAKITHDPTIYQNPPEGYRSYGPLEIQSGSWRRVVD